MYMHRLIAILALTPVAGCFVDVPDPYQLDVFSCREDDDCHEDYRCARAPWADANDPGTCVASSETCAHNNDCGDDTRVFCSKGICVDPCVGDICESDSHCERDSAQPEGYRCVPEGGGECPGCEGACAAHLSGGFACHPECEASQAEGDTCGSGNGRCALVTIEGGGARMVCVSCDVAEAGGCSAGECAVRYPGTHHNYDDALVCKGPSCLSHADCDTLPLSWCNGENCMSYCESPAGIGSCDGPQQVCVPDLEAARFHCEPCAHDRACRVGFRCIADGGATQCIAECSPTAGTTCQSSDIACVSVPDIHDNLAPVCKHCGVGCGSGTECYPVAPATNYPDAPVRCTACGRDGHCGSPERCVQATSDLQTACAAVDSCASTGQPCGADGLCVSLSAPEGGDRVVCAACDCGTGTCSANQPYLEGATQCDSALDCSDDANDHDADGFVGCFEQDCFGDSRCLSWFEVGGSVTTGVAALQANAVDINSSLSPPSVAMQGADPWVVYWDKYEQDPKDRVLARRFRNGGWETIPNGGTITASGLSADAITPWISSAAGRLYVAWEQLQTAPSVFRTFVARTVTDGSSWQDAGLVEGTHGSDEVPGFGTAGVDTHNSKIAARDNGRHVLVYEEAEVYAQIFDAGGTSHWIAHADNATGMVSSSGAGCSNAPMTPDVAVHQDSDFTFVAWRSCWISGSDDHDVVYLALCDDNCATNGWKDLDGSVQGNGLAAEQAGVLGSTPQPPAVVIYPVAAGPEPIVAFPTRPSAGSGTVVWVRRHVAGVGWRSVDNNGDFDQFGNTVRSVDLAMDPRGGEPGRPILVWAEQGSIQALRWEPTSGWASLAGGNPVSNGIKPSVTIAGADGGRFVACVASLNPDIRQVELKCHLLPEP